MWMRSIAPEEGIEIFKKDVASIIEAERTI